VLQVVGTPGDDHAFVGRLEDGRFIVTSDVLPEAWQPRTYDPAGIEQVEMVLLGGDDLGVIAGNVRTPGVLRGGDGADRLVGGSGHDVLLGGEGRDLLAGVRGRDLIIGGGEKDLLVGTMGQDLLIGGSTAHDTNDAALAEIMAEWTADRDLADRVANLSGTGEGGLNGEFLLTTAETDAGPATVFDDGVRDALFGGPGSDWFFARPSAELPDDPGDRIIDATLSDLVDELLPV
jgi:Ca2+-binding RTX toxin-like protein